VVNRVGLLCLLLLAITLPFGTPVTWWPGSAVGLTHLELLLAFAGLAALLQAWTYPEVRGRLPVAWRWLWLWLALAALLAAVAAPAFRWHAFVGAARLLAGMGLVVVTVYLVSDRRQVTWLLAALALGGSAAAGAGLLELVVGTPLAWLDLFRAGPSRAGPFLRLSGPFNHANQAAMYLEALLPFWLALLVDSWRRRRWRLTAVALTATLLMIQALLLTLSRAAWLIGLPAIALTILLLRERAAGRSCRRARLSMAAISLTLLVVALQLAFTPALRMRLLSADDADWYHVRLEAPPELRLAAGQVVTVTVGIQHDGRHLWPPATRFPIRLGAHWFRQPDNYRLDHEWRWPLPEMLEPGEQMLLTVSLPVPQSPGEYRLEWDLVQEDVTWFAPKGGTPAASRVWVEPALSDSVLPPPTEIFRPVATPGVPIPRRPVLWQVAWQQFLVYPLAGIGLDNFRLTYGPFLAWQHWNNTIHTHNGYLEMLVSLGLAGALPFFTWLLLFGRDVIVTLRRPRLTAVQVALALALLAYAAHGLVDYFLMDRATGWLFWLLVGLWLAHQAAPVAGASEQHHEHPDWL
jgi:hypothetical protein